MGNQQARQVEVELTPVNYVPGVTPGAEGQFEGIDAALAGMGLAKIAGFVVSNAADADHDIDTGTGVALASDGSTLTLAVALIKQIDAAWAVGTNLGGLFTGAVAVDTTYHFFLIQKDSDLSLDAGFDTSLSAANIPAGYTAFKRLASFLTDGSSNLQAFVATEFGGGGLDMTYSDPALDIDDGSSGAGGETRTLNVPIDIKFRVRLNAFAAKKHRISSMDQDNEVVNMTSAPLPNVGEGQPAHIYERTNTLGQVRSRAEAGQGGDVLRISTQAIEDGRRD